MDTWQRRTGYYLLALGGIMLGYALVYHWAMATFEGIDRTFLRSLQIVVETFTTTGFGSDASSWDTWQTNLLVIVMDLTGVVLIFLALPVLLFPLFEETISTTPPTEAEGVEDHVVICAYSPRIDMLIDELDVYEVPYVVLEPDRDRAAELVEEGIEVVHGDPESMETLEAVNLESARALVADVDDSTNASIVLTAKAAAPDVRCITFVEDPDIATYHRYAGADQVYSPRRLIGESLASKVTTGITAEVGDAVEIGEDFEIVELPVMAGSELVGETIAESGIRERTGANVIGAWFRGEFVSPPSLDARLDEQTILLVAGHERQLEPLKEMTLSDKRRRRRGHVVICGHGEVGSTVKERVTAEGVPCTTVDKEDYEGVDIVGDVTEKEVLREAGVDEASTVILALSSDTMTIFAALVVRQLNPEVEIIARADQTESVRKLYQAGADYVLALATVSGRMLASTIFEEDIISYDKQVEVVRFDAGKLVGETLAGADIRAETGCTVIAVERNGAVITDLAPEFEIQDGDDVIVAGPDENITEFAARYD
ncbi:potassium channel family protein [Halorientalis regularis]|uniref:Trk K+ transport system, NAD-binding component n=1 Tax=Halorientalis regularis TaxID=660518 RepID=A0A1G7FRR5_9EURY|nr:NAD-binding protein [Halorientalis regularis]SDE78554.1 Trk K+ transport system, NAD-binding component [Halorientalis regularis]